MKSTDIKYDVNDYVTLGDYKDVEVTIGSESDYEVTEDKINDYAAQMISYYCPYVKDDTKTQVGENDIVDVDYVGKKTGRLLMAEVQSIRSLMWQKTAMPSGVQAILKALLTG